MLSVVVLCAVAIGCAAASEPEVGMTPAEIIRYWGYTALEYVVHTQDHRKLAVQRIPYGKSGPTTGHRPVIFMQHGLECSATNWLVNLPNESAAFVFADAGFDVWLGNNRGNNYSNYALNSHLSKDDFWAHSWDEMALFDLPAMIDFALDTSSVTSLYYMGHSQGTMTAFALAASTDAYNDKIKAIFALAPVAGLNYINGMFQVIAHLKGTVYLLGVHEFFPSDWLMKLTAELICGNDVTGGLCLNVMFLLCGPDTVPTQLNTTRLSVYVAHTPSGTSTQNVLHYAQGTTTNKMQKYDWGCHSSYSPYTCANLRHYGQPTPPVYNLTNIKIPLYLYHGSQDVLADPKDIAQNLIPHLAPGILKNVSVQNYNHLDYIWGMEATTQVYLPILHAIQDEYENIA